MRLQSHLQPEHHAYACCKVRELLVARDRGALTRYEHAVVRLSTSRSQTTLTQRFCACRKVRELLAARDRGALAKYEHAVVHSYIEDNAHVRWCPSVPCCERAVEARPLPLLAVVMAPATLAQLV
jgi:hypothetical protein